MSINLYEHQLDALKRMSNGCILNGGVGTGKSLTAIAYFYIKYGGSYDFLNGGEYVPMDCSRIPDLYIITTARKRDTFEWDKELAPFLLFQKQESSLYENKVVIDSWNNIAKYKDVQHAFFIFDEDRVTGNGTWVKTFLKLAKMNRWIILSATPGDTWQDYMPVFIANGFYKNKTEFSREHIVYNPRVKFPLVERYENVGKLIKYRNKILVSMDMERATVRHHHDIFTNYDTKLYKETMKNRWNPWKNEPIQSPSELCFTLRKIVNSDTRKINALLDILNTHPKVIIFYNFDYELNILKSMPYLVGTTVHEWNGHQHEDIPNTDRWVYLVQYASGCEGWNCTLTDTIIFYSENYSYRVMEQACGRIDRVNTPFTNLHYYHLKTKSPIGIAINRALVKKKNFNEGHYVRSL